MIWRVCLLCWRYADCTTLNKVNHWFVLEYRKVKLDLYTMKNEILGRWSPKIILQNHYPEWSCFHNHQKQPNDSRETTTVHLYFLWGSGSPLSELIHRHRTITQSHKEQGGDLLSPLCACLSKGWTYLTSINEFSDFSLDQITVDQKLQV